MSRDAPGRNCPLSYRYSPEVFRRAPEIEAGTLYVIGGLYGNPFALDAIVELAAQESPAPTLVDERWLAQFDRLWPGGSLAAVSYRKRIADGPAYELAQAVRSAVAPRHNGAAA